MKRVYDGGTVDTRAVERAPESAPTLRRLGYQPALDGLRGLAVALVVMFHLDVGVVTGGYLGVSVFFTLSGFLITTLLLERFHDTGGLGLGGFYVRRIKRLVPASATTLVAIAAVTAAGGFFATGRSRGDLVAAALNVFNWREVASGRAYADLFAGDSPVAHFWSLAIEEQFYVVWPVALLAMLRWRRIGSGRLLVAISVLFSASALAAQFASSNVAYFASWTRAAEILAGAWLAVWMLRQTRVAAWWRRLAAPAVGLIVLLSVVTPAASGWAYSGGLAFFSLVSVALIAGLQVPGRVRRALSFGPLVGLGRISYGVYLVHWPVFVFVDEARMGVDGWNLAVTRIGLTSMLALGMYAVVERPIRTSTRSVSLGRAVALATGASLVLVGLAVWWVDAPTRSGEAAPAVLTAAPSTDDAQADPVPSIAPDPPPEAPTTQSPTARAPTTEMPSAGAIAISETTPISDEFAPTPDAIAGVALAGTDAAEAPSVTEPTVDGPTTIAVFGDSVPAWLMRDASRAFARRDVVLVNGANEACDGAVALPLGRDRRRAELRPPEDCVEWTQSYPATLASYDDPVEVGLLVIGQVATVDRLFGDRWKHPCDATGWYVDDVRDRIDFLLGEGIQPVIALPARFGQRATFILPDDHERRISCVRAALSRLALEQQVDTVDLDGLLCVGDDCDGRRRRDGIHIDPEVAGEVLDELVDLTLAAR